MRNAHVTQRFEWSSALLLQSAHATAPGDVQERGCLRADSRVRQTRAVPRRFVAAAVFLVTLALPAAAGAEGACARFAEAPDAGVVGDPRLTEISGLVASRAHDGVLWAHDDSGSDAELVALDAAGRPLGSYRLPGATAVDWEDLAIGPGPEEGRSYLYVGDIGDNLRARDDITVYRVPEPLARPGGAGGVFDAVEAIRLAYPDGPSDAESLLVDPRSGDLYLVTKHLDGAQARILRAEAASLRPGATVSLREIARIDLPLPDLVAFGLPGTMATAADVSPDGSLVLIRTYRTVLAFERPDGEPLEAAFDTEPCLAPQAEERQGEAVAFSAAGDAYLTVSEGEAQPIHRFTVAAAAPAEGDHPRVADTIVDEVAEGGLPKRFLIGAGAAVAGAAFALWLTSRRRAGRRRRRASPRP